jgi:DNA polymerase III subunit delta
MDSLTFLDRRPSAKPQPIYVLTGDEDFLKRQVLTALKALVLAGSDESFGLSIYTGDKAPLATVRDDLDTLPFLGPRRLVVVEEADPFVTLHRASLEKYVGQPSTTGVLVLVVKTWPATTRLAKLVSDAVTITCKAPAAYKLPPWCVEWAAALHGKQLTEPAAQLLVELIGGEMGQLDQELAKLAIYAGSAARIDVDDVDALVGRSQGANLFKIFDAIGSGRAGEALAILDRLFDQNEEPIRILGAFSMQLRRLAQAARLSQHGVPLPAAIGRVGVPPFAAKGSEQQLRHIGPRRAERLYDWLIEIDLGMKGSSPLPPRVLLERLIVQLAKAREN